MGRVFRYIITQRANEKDNYTPSERTVDEFIDVFVKRGVKEGMKDGTGIIGATFKPHTRLEKKNVETVTALILDIDGKFKRDGQVVIEPVDPNWLLSLFPFRGIAHTSHGHTPAHPKFRVIFPLDREVTPEQHLRLWYWAFERAQRKLDPACKNPDRMFYLARAPKESIAQGWPWVRELHGPQLSVDTVPEHFVVPVEAQLAATPKRKVGMHLAAPEAHYVHTDGHKLLEEFMKQPVVQWAVDCPSQVNREAWRGLATNLAAIALETEDDEELFADCLAAFHTISEADGDRYSPGDTTRMFHDAVQSAKQYGPMRFDRLAENGAPDHACASTHKSPIAAARSLVRKQERESPKAEAPAPKPPAEPAGPATPTSPAASTSSTPPVQLTPAGDDDGGDGGDDTGGDGTTIFDHEPDDFLFEAAKNHYLMRNTAGSFDEAKGVCPSAFDTLLRGWGLVTKQQIDIFKAKIRPFHIRAALFNKPTEIWVPAGKLNYFNTYRPSTLEKVAPPCPKSCGAPTCRHTWVDIEALLLNLCGGDAKALEWLLDWLAKPVQCLINEGRHFKMGSAVVLQGAQGSGKGTLHEIMKLVYGESNCALIGQTALESRFHGELIDKLWVTANEVMSSTNRTQEVANILKMWVTDSTIPIEDKGVRAETLSNYFNIVFMSNNEKPVIIEPGDRRYVVFKSRRIAEALSDAVYADLLGKKIQVSAFYEHLLKRKTTIKYGQLYETAAKRDLAFSTLPSEVHFAMDLREDCWHAMAEPWRSSGNPNNPRVAVLDEDLVLVSTMNEVYQDYCRRNGLRAHPQKLPEALKAEIPAIEPRRERVGGVLCRVYANVPMHRKEDDKPTPPEPVVVPESEAGAFAA